MDGGDGTDAAPYFRVFNPVTQGQRFDPDGEYMRRWVPELRHLEGKAAPLERRGRLPRRLPERIVDHAAERRSGWTAVPRSAADVDGESVAPDAGTASDEVGARRAWVRHVRGPSVRLSPPRAGP